MVNQNKFKELRFWKKWVSSGAIGTSDGERIGSGIDSVASVLSRLFLKELSARQREVAIEYLSLPNKADIQPEIMKLHLRYGSELTEISDSVERLRKLVGCNYDLIQQKLRSHLDGTRQKYVSY